MRILGLSAFYHDSAAALVEDGRDRRGGAGGALHPQEARFRLSRTRARLLPGRGAESRSDGVDYVVFYDKPFLKFERLLETYLAFAPTGFRSFRMAIPLWMREKLFQKKLLRDELQQVLARLDWDKQASRSPSITSSHAASRLLSLRRSRRRPS